MKDDLISRQAAVSRFSDLLMLELEGKRLPTWEEVYNAMQDLPSAEPEIIRCKDCKWWDKIEDSPFGYCMAMKHGYMTANWEIRIYRRYKGDFYCADAERRTDD